MNIFTRAIQKHKDLPQEDQKKAGKSIAGKMGDEHEQFVATILGLLDRKEIDFLKPETLLKTEVYKKLSDEWKRKTDRVLVNVCDQLRHIVEFRLSKKTPDSSPQLQTMIEHLWQMKESIESEGHDVFKF